MRHAELLTGTIFCLALSAYAEIASDSAGLGLPDVKATNNQPISKPTRGAIHNERIEPSFDYRNSDGTQVGEYRSQKGRTPDIHVKSGMGTSYNPNKPENSSPRIHERGDIDWVSSVNALEF